MTIPKPEPAPGPEHVCQFLIVRFAMLDPYVTKSSTRSEEDVMRQLTVLGLAVAILGGAAESPRAQAPGSTPNTLTLAEGAPRR